MARTPTPPVVAELGRPETAAETAARKAESSRVYRSSQTFRHLLAALLVTLGVVAVIILAVPRGEVADPGPIDVAAEAAALEQSQGRPVLAPDVPEGWLVNSARMEGDAVPAWTVVYVPGPVGYLRVAQGFDADPAWVSRTLRGAAPDGEVTIDGIRWDRYVISDPAAAGNISYALATDAGPDTVLIYGTAEPADAAAAASGVADAVRELRDAP
jgi:hypothetical protein